MLFRSILEAGTGNGLTVFLLLQQNFQVEGVDITSEWCHYLHYRYGILIHHARFEKFAPTHDYDMVYSSHTIEHTEDPYAFIRKAYEILRPGGFLWIDTPDTYYCEKESGRWHHFETRHPFEHLCLLGIESIEYLAKTTGFKITDWKRQPEYNSIQVIMRKPSKEGRRQEKK